MNVVSFFIIKVLTLFPRPYILEDNIDQGPKFHLFPIEGWWQGSKALWLCL
jgi:hypothetical protein